MSSPPPLVLTDGAFNNLNANDGAFNNLVANNFSFGGGGTAISPSNYNVLLYGAKGDGVNDDSVGIQAAINAANTAGGGVVFCPGGQYRLGSTVQMKSNVILEGVGDGTRIFVPAGTGVWTTADFNLITASAQSNFTIRNIHVTGAGKTYPGSDLTFGGCIILFGCTNGVIENIHAQDANIGVDVEQSNDCRVVNSYFSGKITQDGIRVFTQPGTSGFGNVVADNTLDYGPGASASGIRVGGENNTDLPIGTIVSGNFTRIGTGFEGIMAQHANQTTIVGNVSIGNAYGIAIYGGQANVISGNTVRDNLIVGILLETLQAGDVLDHNVVTNNTVVHSGTQPARDAIYVSADNGGISCDSNLIQSNYIDGCTRRGVYVVHATNTDVSNNTIRNTGEAGIFLDTTSSATKVTGNLIINPGNAAIFVDHTTLALVDHNLMTTTIAGFPAINANATKSIFCNNLSNGFSFVSSIVGTNLVINNNSERVNDFVALGTNPAASGLIRLPSQGTIAFRNQANTADLVELTTDAADHLIVGNATGRVIFQSGDILDCRRPILLTEQPGAPPPATATVLIFAQNNGSGKTQLMALFATGAPQQIAIQP